MIVVMTPRAGSRNHLYLVPENAQYTRVDIMKLLGYRQSSPENGIVVAHRSVSQTSTGRPGQETVAVYDPAIKASHLGEIERELDEFKTSFERRVLETLEKYSADTSRIIRHPELTRLEDGIANILGKPGGRTATKLPSTKKFPGKLCLRVILLLLALVLVAVLVARYRNGEIEENGQGNGQGNGKGGASGTELTESEEAALDSMLKLMGKKSVKRDQLAEVHKEFGKVLLQDDPKNLSDDPKTLLKKNLKVFLRYAGSKDWETKDDLEDLLATSKEFIEDLYSNGKLDRLGLMKEPNKFELDDAKASEFSRMVTNLALLQELLNSEDIKIDDLQIYSDFFSTLKGSDFRLAKGIADGDRLPLFFPRNTNEILANVNAFFAEKEATKVTKLEGSLVGVEFLKELKAKRDIKETLLSSTKLKSMTEVFEESGQAFEYLDRFLESLCSLVD